MCIAKKFKKYRLTQFHKQNKCDPSIVGSLIQLILPRQYTSSIASIFVDQFKPPQTIKKTSKMTDVCICSDLKYFTT